MNKKTLLFASALMLCISGNAQTFTAQWERPVPTEFAEWEPETSFYLYNEGANAFYIAYQGGGLDEAPYWRTRSSVNDTIGAEVKFTRTNPDNTFEDAWDQADENTYLLVNWVPKFQEFRCTFSQGAFNSVWTDNNRDYDHGWNIIVADDGSFRIEGNNGMRLSEYNYTGKYIGVVASDPDRVLYLRDEEALGSDVEFYDTWRVMTPEAYEQYIDEAKNQIKRVLAADKLKADIESALAAYQGLDLTADIAVYNNTSSTLEELESATADVAKAIVDRLSGGASPSNPRNMTDLINNPGFDGGNYDGWSGDRFGAGGDVDDVAEHWNKNFDTYQEISGLPAGVYLVRVNGFYRAGGSPQDDNTALRAGRASNTRLYITGKTLGEFSTPIKHLTETSITEPLGLADGGMQTEMELVTDEGSLWFPNTMVGANAYFHLESNPTLYRSEIAGAIGEGDVLRFGVKKSTLVNADWSIFDDFELLYYGDSEEAYQVIVNNMLATNEVILDGEGVFYGKAEYEAYEAASEALAQSTTLEAIQENMPKLTDAREALAASVEAYAKYLATIESVNDWAMRAEDEGMTGADFYRLTDYLQEDGNAEGYPNGNLRNILPDFDEGNGQGLLSTDEILAEIEYVEELKATAIRNSLYDGLDLTDLIRNPGFEMGGASGWQTDAQYNGGNITNWHGGQAGNYAAECFNHNFDVYQVIEGLENGLYEVSVQAFYRTTDNQNAENAYNYGYDEAKVLSEVYLNEFSTPVKNVFEIKYTENLANNCYATTDGYYTLDGMASASAAFSLDDEELNFTQKVYGLVTDGTLRLGIRNLTGSLNARWTLFDNFHLIYRAKNVDALTSVIANYAERAEALDGYVYGLPESNALATAVETAQNASTGNEMYDALIALVGAYVEANASVEAYAKLDDALSLFNTALNDAAINNPTSPAYNDAADYFDDTDEAYGNRDLTKEEALEAVEEINQWISKLRIPAYDGASDDTPIDMTAAIVNPSFDIVNDFNGWSGTAFGTGGDAGANAEHYERNFDSYQVIYGLPAGTYEVTVKGMYRHGSATNDYNAFKAAEAERADNPEYVDPTQLVFLYAKTEATQASAPVNHCADGGKATPDFSGTNAGTDDDPCYVADSRTSADLYFHDEEAPDAYLTSVIIKIDEGEALTIGVMRDGDVPTYSWSIFDDFTLTYYGTNSSKTETGDAVAISDTSLLSAQPAAIYNVSGVRLQNMQRGINIVRTADGTSRKVLIK